VAPTEEVPFDPLDGNQSRIPSWDVPPQISEMVAGHVKDNIRGIGLFPLPF
jgi:hypothetical protein